MGWAFEACDVVAWDKEHRVQELDSAFHRLAFDLASLTSCLVACEVGACNVDDEEHIPPCHHYTHHPYAVNIVVVHAVERVAVVEQVVVANLL